MAPHGRHARGFARARPARTRRGRAAQVCTTGCIGGRTRTPRAARPQPGDKLHKLGGVLGCEGPEEIYRALVSQWPRPEAVARASPERPDGLPPFPTAGRGPSPESLAAFTRWMGLADMVTYLPDDILAKVDRASMGVSLEARVPLLDHRVVEFLRGCRSA